MKKISVLLAVLLAALACVSCQKAPESSITEETRMTFERAEYDAVTKADGLYTMYNNGAYYDERYALFTDTAIAYSMSYENVPNQIASWKDKGYEHVGLYLGMCKDYDYYVVGKYDGKEHFDIVQKNSAGAYKTHANADIRQVHPSEGWAKFLAAWAKRGIAAGADAVYVEEPDGWLDYAYSDYVKEQWVEAYGTPWRNYEESKELQAMKDALLAKILADAYVTFATEVKAAYPQVKVYFTTHSSISYAGEISVNNARIAAQELIDGTVAEVWTDTCLSSVFFEGKQVVLPYENSYIQCNEVANYGRGLSGKAMVMMSDTKSDNPVYTYEMAKDVWTDNLVSQLMMPQNSAFHVGIWSERSFRDAPIDYKAVQEGIFKVLGDIHEDKTVRYAGTSGIGVAMNYNACSSVANGQYAIYSLTIPLVREGLPIEILSLEDLTSAKALEGIKTLVLSYEFIRPENKQVNRVIADWVRAGGSLLYIGGQNYADTYDFWWADEGYASPQAHLFGELGLQVKSYELFRGVKTLSPAQGAPSYFSAATVDNYYNVTSYETEGAVPLMTAEGKTVAFEQKVGNGAVTVLGTEPEAMSAGEDSFALYEMFLKRALDRNGQAYRAPKASYTVRGDLEAYRTFGRTFAIEGTFLDLMSYRYEVVKNPVIPEHTSKLYLRIDDKEGLVFSNSVTSSLDQSDTRIQAVWKNVLGSRARAVFRIPQGKTVASVSALHTASGTAAEVTQTVSGDYLTVSYDQGRSGDYRVTVTFA